MTKFSIHDSINDVVFACFDIETTGLDANYDKIVEFGMVLCTSSEELNTYQTFVNIGEKIPEKAVEIHKITDDMIKEAPPITKVLEDVMQLLEGKILVAHNIEFDYRFLNAELHRNGFPALEKYLLVDTVKLARKVFPDLPRHTLDHISTHLGITIGNHHRALDDAQACKKILFECANALSILGDLTLSEILI